MFGFGKTEQVVPLSYRDGLLTFTCGRKFKVGKSTKVKLTLIYGQSVHTPTVPVTVVAVDPNDDGTFNYSAGIDLAASKLPTLVMQLAYGGIEGADRRETRRIACTVRILSKEIASFRAVTTNINDGGTELYCDGPVAVGHYMNLQFDLETVGFPELKMQAQCLWCSEEVDESRKARYRVGVAFTSQHAETHAAWSKFYYSLLKTEGASIMAKTMDGGSVTEKKSETTLPTSSQATLPSASESGKWTPPPAAEGANPFAGQTGPAIPSTPAGSSLNFVTPPAEVPSSSQMGGGFSSQAAPPPPLAANTLPLATPAREPQPPALPGFGASLGPPSFLPPALSEQRGFDFAPPSQAGGFPFPAQPQQDGFGIPSAQAPGGFPSAGGFGVPPAPPQQVGFGFPSSQSPGFPPPQQTGFQAPSASSSSSSSGGFQFPGASPPQQTGFGFPSAHSSGGFPSPSHGSGGFPAPSVPSPPASTGFNFPPSAHSSGGFPVLSNAPFQPQGPEVVSPVGINGGSLAFRCRTDESWRAGVRKDVLLSLTLDGRSTQVPIAVSLSRVEPGHDGSSVCWATILEDEQKIQVLNQLLSGT